MMPATPAARLTDMHVCGPGLGIPKPIVGPCSPNVFTMGLPQARVTDMMACIPGECIVMGSFTVFVNGLPAARLALSVTNLAGVIVGPCAPTVLIGT